jgi:hypothetical protein
MPSDYTFLTDHSYSLPLDVDDNDELSLNQREGKNKKRPRSSSRTSMNRYLILISFYDLLSLDKTTSIPNRTESIDRSSSDKENNSLVLSNSNDVPISATTSSSSSNVRSSKKKPVGSRRSRLAARTLITNPRTQSGKKQDNKTSSKVEIVNCKKRIQYIRNLDWNEVNTR